MLARFPGNYSEHPKSSNWIRRTFGRMRPKRLLRWQSTASHTIEQWECDHPEISEVVLWDRSDTPIDMVRNSCVRDALATNCDYLLMIDSDMAPDEDGDADVGFWGSSWEWIRRQHVPTCIAAPYVGPGFHQNIYVFMWSNMSDVKFGQEFNFSLRQYTREEAAMRGGIEPVAALPTGLILYDMRLFDRLRPPYYYYDFNKHFSAKESTEDVTNTRNLSILWHDVPGAGCYCNWDHWARHIKLTEFGPPVPHTNASVGEHLKRAWEAGIEPGERVVDVGGSNRLVTMDLEEMNAKVRKAFPDYVQMEYAGIAPHTVEWSRDG